MKNYAEMLNALRDEIHNRNVLAGWWTCIETGERKERNFGELIALAHSELSEALEGYRKNLMDDHLSQRPMVEVEIADCIVRLMDLCGGFGFDIGGALVEKLEYNARREDHRIESRRGENGKKF